MTGTFLLIGASLIAGLLCGWVVASVAASLPAAMKHAWRDDPAEVLTLPRPRHGLTEATCGIAFTLLAARLGLGWPLAAAMSATAALLTLAIIDWQHRLLPDVIVHPLLWLGLLINAQALFAPIKDAVIGAAMGYASLWAVSRAYRLMCNRTGIGDGDLKLLAALGAWLGWKALLPITLTAGTMALTATVAALFARRGHADRMLPYGTYLALAGWLLLALGQVPDMRPATIVKHIYDQSRQGSN